MREKVKGTFTFGKPAPPAQNKKRRHPVIGMPPLMRADNTPPAI